MLSNAYLVNTYKNTLFNVYIMHIYKKHILVHIKKCVVLIRIIKCVSNAYLQKHVIKHAPNVYL